MAGYLFVHFTGEQQYGEQIYFSISRDGLHWKDLNGHRPVLYSDIGEKEPGIRSVSGMKKMERFTFLPRIFGSKREKAGKPPFSAEAGI